MGRKSLSAALGVALASGGLVAAAPAYAAFPGENGEIAFARTVADLVNPLPPTVFLRRELRTIDPATGQERLIAEGAAIAQIGAPTAGVRDGEILSAPEFSPDGTMLVTNAYAPTQPDEGLLPFGLLLPFGKDVTVYDARSATEQCTYVGPVSAGAPQYDAARGQILLSRAPNASLPFFYDGAPERTDVSCNLIPPSPTPAPLNSQFALSPDGSRIVVGQNIMADSPPTDFVVQNIDGSGPMPPFPLGERGFSPDWTPDQSEIVYGFIDETAMESGIKALNPGTGVIREIVTESSDSLVHFPAVSPDGTKIVYSRVDVSTPLQGGLLVVDSDRDANDPAAPPPTPLTGPSGSFISTDLQPDWGPKPPPEPAPPAPPPAPEPAPGPPPAPTSGDAVCTPVPERRTSSRGRVAYTRSALKIQQNIDSAVLRRLNAINAWIDAGIEQRDLCASAFGPSAFQAGMSFVGGGSHDATPPEPRAIQIQRQRSRGQITRSRRQLVINERISRALRARAVATLQRISALTGGNLAPQTTLAGRAVWPGLTTAGPQPESLDGPATPLSIGRLPRAIPIRENAATVRAQQRRSQGSIRIANRSLDAIRAGLTPENFTPGSIGSGHF